MLGDASYSKTEMELFEHFGFADIAGNMQPPMLYTILASKAFMMNDQTRWADGLRRCLTAFEKGSAYRCTPEWDALILGKPSNGIYSTKDPEDFDDFGGK